MDPSAGASSHGESRTSRAEETRELGRRLGAAAVGGTLVALTGPLGAGKTQLAKGVADGLGVRGVVNSPTFVLMNEHEGRLRLLHIDAYRLGDPEEAIAAGLLDERQANAVTVLEWADRLHEWLPVERLDIEIGLVREEPNARVLRWRGSGGLHARLAAEALGDPAQAGEVAAAS